MRWPVATLVLAAAATAVLGEVTQRQIEEDKLLAKSKKVRTPLDVLAPESVSLPTGLFSQVLQANLPFVVLSLGLLGLLALSQEFRHALMNQQNEEEQANQILATEQANHAEKYNKLQIGSVQDILDHLSEKTSLTHYYNSIFKHYTPPKSDEVSDQRAISVLMPIVKAALKGDDDLTLYKVQQATELLPEEAEDRSDFHPTLMSMMNALSRGIGLDRITGGTPQQYPSGGTSNMQPPLVSLLNALPRTSGSGRVIGLPPQQQLDRNHFQQQPLMQILSTLATGGRSVDRVIGPPQPNYQHLLGSLMGSLSGDRDDEPSQDQRSSTPFTSGPLAQQYLSLVNGLFEAETPFSVLADVSKKAVAATTQDNPTGSMFSGAVPKKLLNSKHTTVYHAKTNVDVKEESGHRTINIGAPPDNPAPAR